MPDAKPPRPRLGAVGIAVADLDRSAAFYRATFGMVDVMTFDLPHMQEIVLGFEGGRGAALVLMQYTDGSDNSRHGDPLKLVMYVADPVAVATTVGDGDGAAQAVELARRRARRLREGPRWPPDRAPRGVTRPARPCWRPPERTEPTRGR